MTSNRRMSRARASLASFATLILASVVVLAGVVVPATPAAALSGSDFDPGYIISDERFFDYTSMSEADIQAFLNAKVANCRATDSTLPCLKSLVTSTNNRAPGITGHCTGYSSEGWESAARIIWKVSQSCRINPQVLLATLEKEQGIVTASRPDSWQYKAAMGYGCPDTAPCDAAYFGFFNQVYMGAWQFRQYTLRPAGWRHQVGLTQIYWSPNSACGTSVVNIRNQATANLYNYTPYRPNAASLANLAGTGDACSTYGNRNFWRFFNSWFGLSTAGGVTAIDSLYASLGGSSGQLGSATSDYIPISTPVASGTGRAYAAGSIYWTARTGAAAVSGAYRDLYFAYNGASGSLSWPNSQRMSIGSGEGQSFVGGSIYSSPESGVHSVQGTVRDAYFSLGSVFGVLGWPTAESSRIAATVAGTVQQFQGGSLYMSALGNQIVGGQIASAYSAAGGPAAAIGWPLTPEYGYQFNGGGYGQMFEGGSIFASTAGSYVVKEPIRTSYFAAGGAAGALGWPTATGECVNAETCSQSFQGGTLYWTAAEGARIGLPAIEASYAANGGVGGPLGARASGLVKINENGGGFGQTFAGGSIYASPAGAFIVRGGIRDVYWGQGGAAGPLAFPQGEATCDAAGNCQQAFRGASIYWSPTGGGRIGLPAIEDALAAAGGVEGFLGQRASGLIVIAGNGGGHGQVFMGGSIYASASGAFPVSGAIRDAYFGVGGSSGAIGWPTGLQSCDPDGTCSQQFQFGRIISKPGLPTQIQ